MIELGITIEQLVKNGEMLWPSESDSPVEFVSISIVFGLPIAYHKETGSETIRRLAGLPDEKRWNYLLDLLMSGGTIQTYIKPTGEFSVSELLVVYKYECRLIGIKTKIVNT